jgi:hypothetical protein
VSVAVIVKETAPVVVGVPLITPDAPVKLNPAGKDPTVTENVLAPVPPVAATVSL